MGIISMYVKDLTIDGLKLTKDDISKGMVSNAADAMHLVATKGKLEIKNCIVEGMIDDALNIHTLFYEAESANGTTLQVFRHQRSHCLNTHFTLFGIGDKIAVYKGQSLELKQTATITDIKQIDSQYMCFTTDIPLENVEKGDLIENLSTQPEVHIHNCFFGKSNTHLRIQTRGKTSIYMLYSEVCEHHSLGCSLSCIKTLSDKSDLLILQKFLWHLRNDSLNLLIVNKTIEVHQHLDSNLVVAVLLCCLKVELLILL